MGQISLAIPQTGLPNSTEDPKIASDLTTIQTVINGSLDDSNLYSPNGAVRHLLLQTTGLVPGSSPPNVYFPLVNSNVVVPNAAGTVPAHVWAPDAGIQSQPADFTVAHKTTYARVRGTVTTNSVAPGMTFTMGLYQLTTVAGSGTISYAGSLLGGTTAALSSGSLTAGGTFSFESAQFTLPTAGSGCILGIQTTPGTTAANSLTAVTCQLYAYNA